MIRFNTFLLEQEKSEQGWGEWAKNLATSTKDRILEVDPVSTTKGFFTGKMLDRLDYLSTIEKRIDKIKKKAESQGKVADPNLLRRLEMEYDREQANIDKDSTDLALTGTALELGGGAVNLIPGVGQVVGIPAYLTGVAQNIGSAELDIRSGIGDIKQAYRTGDSEQGWDAARRIGLGAASGLLSLVPAAGALIKTPIQASKAARTATELAHAPLVAKAEQQAVKNAASAAEAAEIATRRRQVADALKDKLSKMEHGNPFTGSVQSKTRKAEEAASRAEQKATSMAAKPNVAKVAKETAETAAAGAARQAGRQALKYSAARGALGKVTAPFRVPAKLLRTPLGAAIGGGAAALAGAGFEKVFGGLGGGGGGGGEDGGGGGGTPQFVSGLSPTGQNVGRLIGK